MKFISLFGPVLLAGLLSACTLGPDYRKPELALPAQWQAPLPHHGSSSELNHWWAQFDDPLLSQLIAQAESDSPSLDQALARIEQSRANVASARSQLFPALNAGAAFRRSGGKMASVAGNVTSATLDASWEIDLFGANRRAREAAQARLGGSEAAWHDAKVSLAAEVAQEYVNYRACEALLAYTQADLDSSTLTEKLTLEKVGFGFASPSDGALSRASRADASTRRESQHAECEIGVKAMVALTGLDEPTLRKRLAERTGQLPQPATLAISALPAQTLAHRPDIAAAERELAAVSAEIGGAEAARYPKLTLSGSIGLQSLATGGNSQSGSLWSFGPALDLPIFDAGRRAAGVDAARARYAEALAAYKAKTRQAVREVEQALVRLSSNTLRESESRQASENYAAVLKAADIRWQTGLGSLLDLEETRRLATNARTQHVIIQRDSILSWISLYRATGGDWAPTTSTQNQP